MVIKYDQATFQQLPKGGGGSLRVRRGELLRKVLAVQCMTGVKPGGLLIRMC